MVAKLLLKRLNSKGFQSRYKTIQGCKMHWIVKGGFEPALVFIHGFGADSVHWHKVLLKVAETGRKVVSLDLPGHGFSEDYEGRLSVDVLHAAAAEFLKTELSEKCFLVGNSLGGTVTLKIAADNPELVKAALVVSPAGKFESPSEWEDFKKDLKVRDLRSARRLLKRLYHDQPWFLSLLSPLVLRSLTRKGPPEILDSVEMEKVDAWFKPFALPVLIIWGRSESLLPRRQLHWFRNRLPKGVTFEEPADVGHCPQLDKPDWLAGRILDYVNVQQ